MRTGTATTLGVGRDPSPVRLRSGDLRRGAYEASADINVAFGEGAHLRCSYQIKEFRAVQA